MKGKNVVQRGWVQGVRERKDGIEGQAKTRIVKKYKER